MGGEEDAQWDRKPERPLALSECLQLRMREWQPLAAKRPSDERRDATT
jgi:hypothetical protein